jgi:hypothetical protein
MADDKEPVAAPAVVAPAIAEVPAPASVAAAEPTLSPPSALPPSDSAPAADAPAEPTRTPTLLEKFDTEAKAAADAAKPKEPAKAEPAKDAPKPGEAKETAKLADGDKPAETEKPAEPAALEPVAYEYKVPETLKMDDAVKGKLHSALDAFRADPTKGAQSLIDLHNETMQTYAEQLAKDTLAKQFEVFNQTKADKEIAWKADPEIGGAGYQTAMRAIARTRDLGVSSARPGTKQYISDQKEFDEFLAITGAGSWPAFGRLLHNLARYTDEPQSTSIPTEIKPPKSNGRAPGNFKDTIYDNPRSHNGSA